MMNSWLLLMQMLSFFLVDNYCFKIIGVFLFLMEIVVLKNKLNVYKRMLLDLVYLLFILIINIFINVSFDLLNFICFNLFGFMILMLKKEIKIDDYCRIYLFLCFITGVMSLWGNF